MIKRIGALCVVLYDVEIYIEGRWRAVMGCRKEVLQKNCVPGGNELAMRLTGRSGSRKNFSSLTVTSPEDHAVLYQYENSLGKPAIK